MSDSPSIYVACLSSYNNGVLHGAWIDLDIYTHEDDVLEVIAEMLAESPARDADEWDIHDTQGFHGLDRELCSDIDDYCKLADVVRDHEPAAMAAYNDCVGFNSIDSMASSFEEAYQGEYSDEVEFAEQFAEDVDMLGELPEHLKPYFDIEKYARDLFLDGFFMVNNRYVFANI